MSEEQVELKTRKDELVAIIQSIESQLSQKDKSDPETGRRLGEREYHEWRARALEKRRHLLEELREVKAKLTEIGEEDHLQKRERQKSQLDRIEEKVDLLLEHLVSVDPRTATRELLETLEEVQANADTSEEHDDLELQIITVRRLLEKEAERNLS